MGRALYSKTYRSTPAVRTEPEPVVDTICQKWSAWNKFDPDSDEFFVDAEYEAFIVPPVQPTLQEPVHDGPPAPEAMTFDSVSVSDSSSDSSSDGASSDGGSPMATGPDDPAAMIADAYPNLTLTAEQWEQRIRSSSSATEEWLNDFARPTFQRLGADDAVNLRDGASREEPAGDRPYRANRPRSVSAAPALVPLSELLTQSRPADVHQGQIPTPPLSPPLPEPVNARPTNTPARPRSRSTSPVREAPPLDAPTTPQRANVRGSTQTALSPSPPPSVSPRFYSWQNHPIPALPTSPTVIRGNRDGLLTNPHARRSYVRIGSAQGPALVTNTAI
ncbi:hypothetical protein EST38_g1016 [Candolleomyces aberdarensis]|uniref:Uncharacterized protein n=1 Tax=Candolleomyces aberdarensis TaxID=2316362 RepID=A0A4Q2DY44_9AGAR|nr:hypothetical protein EST38_g1016 [Candolleomyces aberdarensis]